MRAADLANPGVCKLEPYQPGKPIEALERDYGIRDAIKLASNENPIGPSPQALDAVRGALPEIARYPEGDGPELKARLASRLGVAAEQITLGNGSNDVLDLVARTFAGPGHEVVFSQYGFLVYALVTQAVGARPVTVPAQDWGHDLEAILASVNAATRIVYLANPNNPTGTWFGAAALEQFLEVMPEHVIVVLDEAYFEYVAETDYPNGIELLDKYPQLVVTRTFSKAYGLAGLRMGYAVSSGDIADLLNRVRQPFNVNSLAQAAALAALDDEAHLTNVCQLNRDGLAQCYAGLADLALPYIPSVANFVSVEVGDASGAIYEALLRAGVIVRPLANYDMPRHLRVSIGRAEENRRALDALAAALGAT